MKHLNILRAAMVATACVGFLMPPPVLAIQPIAGSDRVVQTHDILLHNDGVFVGQVVRADGQPREAATVSLQQRGVEVARVHTDANGYFAVRGVRQGLYMVQTADTTGSYRAWSTDVAPPAAKPSALLISNAEVVRGQCGCEVANCSDCDACGGGGGGGGGGALACALSRPLVIGAIVATAIAVPVALHDDDSGS